MIGAALALIWQLSLAERAITFFAPPLAFLVVVTIATAIAGGERIVFYQTTPAAVVAVIAAGARADGDLARWSKSRRSASGRFSCSAS